MTMQFQHVQDREVRSTTGWWFGPFFHILGISSSQPPFMFFRVVGQPPTRQDHEANLTFDIHGFMGVLGGSSRSAGLLTQG